ncbi:hypothetical protein EBT16_12050, partial [bacterium]|nr:hypothetical protein [bacterium]
MSNDTPRAAFSRKEWQKNTQFHPLSESEVLRLVGEAVGQFKGLERPLVLLDLDSTLYEVGPRTLQIIQEWIPTYSHKLPFELRMALETLPPEKVGYSLKDTLSNLGFPVVTEAMESLVQ